MFDLHDVIDDWVVVADQDTLRSVVEAVNDKARDWIEIAGDPSAEYSQIKALGLAGNIMQQLLIELLDIKDKTERS